MKRSALDQRISQGVLIGDGATGAMLYQYGVFLNRCFDELNRTDAKLIRKVLAGYVEAGVDAIKIPDGPRASSRLSPLVTADAPREIERFRRKVLEYEAQVDSCHVWIPACAGTTDSSRTGMLTPG